MTLLDSMTGLVHVAEVLTNCPSNPRHEPYEVTVTDCDQEAETSWIKVARVPTCLWCAVRK